MKNAHWSDKNDGADWREVVEKALGIECNPEKHDPTWALHTIRQLKDQHDALRERLQFDPGGSDKIDELEQARDFTKHARDVAEKKNTCRLSAIEKTVKRLQEQVKTNKLDLVELKDAIRELELKADEIANFMVAEKLKSALRK